MPNWTLYEGDCLEVMRQLPDNSVDAVVTDPPYGLEFMGKEWDKLAVPKPGNLGGFADGNKPSFERVRRHLPAMQEWHYRWAVEALRILKPGGHLVAFGGTRTYHRLACAIEDAGFEVRDCLMWLYGSGFPKSLDVSKALDIRERGKFTIKKIQHFREKRGFTRKQLGELAGFKDAEKTVWDWEIGGHVPSEANWNLIKRILDITEEEEKAFEREKIGERQKLDTFIREGGYVAGEADATHYDKKVIDITAPATELAKKWNGWGTALKPAHEPIIMARKPLDGTVADNVERWGTGALNIDGCRIEYQSEKDFESAKGGDSGSTKCNIFSANGKKQSEKITPLGRFPANVILDEEAGRMLDEQSGVTRSGKVKSDKSAYAGISTTGFLRGITTTQNQHGDSGGASRFFYCAKASKKERGEGNNHPTVKPIKLMRYLCRLITPPGGTVFDPFAGSGTTILAAVQEGFSCIGIEKEPEYCEIIRKRMAEVQPALPLVR